jgi:hypothetical protein
MTRPALFVDLAGTLDVRDPATGRWGLWPGIDTVLADLAAHCDLYLTTGDSPDGAQQSLVELGLTRHFAGVRAGLPGGGKPFGAIAAELGREPARCLALGDNPVSDTAGDTDAVVSVLLDHRRQRLVSSRRAGAVLAQLLAGGTVLQTFSELLATAATSGSAPNDEILIQAVLYELGRGEGVYLGWWEKLSRQRRPVVVVTGEAQD